MSRRAPGVLGARVWSGTQSSGTQSSGTQCSGAQSSPARRSLADPSFPVYVLVAWIIDIVVLVVLTRGCHSIRTLPNLLTNDAMAMIRARDMAADSQATAPRPAAGAAASAAANAT